MRLRNFVLFTLFTTIMLVAERAVIDFCTEARFGDEFTVLDDLLLPVLMGVVILAGGLLYSLGHWLFYKRKE